MDFSAGVSWIHYFPVATTIIAAAFATLLARRYAERRSTDLLWWTLGIACYGVGTFCEAWITLFGNSVPMTKTWYIFGALLGGYPLAQGSVYRLYSRAFANRATAITVPIVGLTALLVWLSPVHLERLELHRPTGAVLAWRWVRLMTPFINIYAVVFLIGGAAWSSWRYVRLGGQGAKAAGNALIATGAIMPGIGGSIAKAGTVEALYVLECFGLILIWAGDRVSRQGRRNEDRG